MNTATYTGYELLRTVRNRRVIIFALAFPVILFLAIAAPNRHVADFSDTGLSLPLYFMVGLAAFATMNAMLASGGRIAADRAAGWNRQLRVSPLSP
jgi:ABC-2 type transport system permease protein